MGFEGQENKAIYFRGSREQNSKTEGNRGNFGEQGPGNIENLGTRENADFFRRTREQVSHPT